MSNFDFINWIPALIRHAHRLDDISLLIDNHWLLLSDNPTSKVIFIFKNKGRLIISRDGLVEQANWEAIDRDTILIQESNTSRLCSVEFMDDFVMILKLENWFDDYAFFINERTSSGYISSVMHAVDFIKSRYSDDIYSNERSGLTFSVDQGELFIEYNEYGEIGMNSLVFLNEKPAPDGRYDLEFMHWIEVVDGKLVGRYYHSM